MHSHQTLGDPQAATRLSVAIEELRAALLDGDEQRESTVTQTARLLAQALLSDANPRTRSQARGLAMVASLVGNNRREEALQLLEQELWRSFTGRGGDAAASASDHRGSPPRIRH